MLRISNMEVNYGSIKALKGISMSVEKGEIVSLIGANGAGKTTTMNAIMGLADISKGRVEFEGKDITRTETQLRVKSGIVLAPEGRQVFPLLSVCDNLMMGGYFFNRKENQDTLEIVYQLFPILKERCNQQAGTLSGGEQQMLAVGRAVMARPKLLLLDEPSLGLAPLIVKEIFKLIQEVRNMGVTILLVEQNAKMALSISDRAYVLETGKVVHSGPAASLMNLDEIKNAYLGG